MFNIPAVENTSSVTAYHGLVLLNLFGQRTVYTIKWDSIHEEAWFVLTSSPDITILGPVFLLVCSAPQANFLLVCRCLSTDIPLFKSLSSPTNLLDALKHHGLHNPFPDSTLLTYSAPPQHSVSISLKISSALCFALWF